MPLATPMPLPRHIAIIMDGNGRWASARGMPRQAGHREGVEPVRQLGQQCEQRQPRQVTAWIDSPDRDVVCQQQGEQRPGDASCSPERWRPFGRHEDDADVIDHHGKQCKPAQYFLLTRGQFNRPAAQNHG